MFVFFYFFFIFFFGSLNRRHTYAGTHFIHWSKHYHKWFFNLLSSICQLDRCIIVERCIFLLTFFILIEFWDSKAWHFFYFSTVSFYPSFIHLFIYSWHGACSNYSKRKICSAVVSIDNQIIILSQNTK